MSFFHSKLPSHLFSIDNLEDLLQRNPVRLDKGILNAFLAGKKVLVTGAGGSIGKELCRQLQTLEQKQLIMVDNSEYNLFALEKDLTLCDDRNDTAVLRMADIRNPLAMEDVFSSYRPDIVFHAAAYKHVPLMERFPLEAFQNNTLATAELIQTAERFGTEQFIFVSTDKAVNPKSVMGCTKRLSEWYVRAANGRVQTKTVRFGNVFGSTGSVVPVFLEQIAKGGPVTVTDPDMRRYFMTLHDACCLILHTLLLDVAPIYTLRMDPAISIHWLAERMIERLNPDPGTTIPIKITGKRPGEKITEELWETTENPVATSHPDILGLHARASFSRQELETYLQQLTTLCSEMDHAGIRQQLFQAASQWTRAETHGVLPLPLA